MTKQQTTGTNWKALCETTIALINDKQSPGQLTIEDQKRQRNIAANCFREHSGCPRYKEHCSACALGSETTFEDGTRGINYAGWALLYVAASCPVNPELLMGELASDNAAYVNNIVRYINTFGVRYTG